MNKKWYVKNAAYKLWIWLFMLLKYVYIHPSERLVIHLAMYYILQM